MSTNTALLQVNNFMLEAAERKEFTGTVFIDQSSAFDLVDHTILLDKMREYNWCSNSIRWLESYLDSRTYRVQVESRRSDLVSVGPYGVPQGSILGSLLFILSQNDLPEATPSCSSRGQAVCYVDDDSEQESHQNPVSLMSALQTRVDNVVSWLEDNCMVVAPSKTKLIISSTPELRAVRLPDQPLSIRVGSRVVEATQSEKLLGIILSQDMSWKTHLWGESWREEKNQQGVFPQLIRRLGMLKVLSKTCSKEKLKSFIPAMFTSKIFYALPVIACMWGLQSYREQEPNKYSLTQHDMARLQSLQRQAGLLLRPPEPNTPIISTVDLLSDIKWLSVHQMGAYTIITQTLKIMKTGKPEYFSSRLTRAATTRSSKGNLTVPSLRLNVSLEGFVNQATRLYNQLPEYIKDEENMERQKVFLKEWVLLNISTKVNVTW